MELNSNLVAILNFIADQLSEDIENHRTYDYSRCDAGCTYNSFLNECFYVLRELSEPDSVYHVISKEAAINLITDHIKNIWPSCIDNHGNRFWTYIDNTIRFNLIKFFGETTGTVPVIPEDPSDDNKDPVDPPTDGDDNNEDPVTPPSGNEDNKGNEDPNNPPTVLDEGDNTENKDPVDPPTTEDPVTSPSENEGDNENPDENQEETV